MDTCTNSRNAEVQKYKEIFGFMSGSCNAENKFG